MANNTPFRISVCNQKGGVGKSTLTMNIAGALAHVDHDVLVVDMDPNGHLTIALDHKDAYLQSEGTLYNVLANDGVTIDETIVQTDEFDLVPSNISLFGLERELISMRQGELQLKKALDQLVAETVDRYDFIIIDSPPSLGMLTDNAIVATQRLLVPVEASETSTHAMELLINQVELLEETFNLSIDRFGIIISNVEYPPDGEEQKMIDWFNDTFNDMIPVYEVRKRVVISRAWNNSGSVFNHAESTDMEKNLLEIANDLVDAATEEIHAR